MRNISFVHIDLCWYMSNAQNNYFLMTSDVLDRKLNKENQIYNFSSFFNEKWILIEIWYSMNFCVKIFFLNVGCHQKIIVLRKFVFSQKGERIFA
jgi:hypothetical protein